MFRLSHSYLSPADLPMKISIFQNRISMKFSSLSTPRGAPCAMASESYVWHLRIIAKITPNKTGTSKVGAPT